MFLFHPSFITDSSALQALAPTFLSWLSILLQDEYGQKQINLLQKKHKCQLNLISRRLLSKPQQVWPHLQTLYIEFDLVHTCDPLLQWVRQASGVYSDEVCVIDWFRRVWTVRFGTEDSIPYWQIFHISPTDRDVTTKKISFERETTVNIRSPSHWIFLITHKMCSKADISCCCLSDSPQMEGFFFFPPDQTEMNHIFQLFVVTNPAILHIDVISVLSQLSNFYQWQKFLS